MKLREVFSVGWGVLVRARRPTSRKVDTMDNPSETNPVDPGQQQPPPVPQHLQGVVERAQRPSPGRIVHYVGNQYDGGMEGKLRPAIIVHVNGDTNVNIQVFTDGSNDGASNTVSKKSVVFSPSPRPGYWSWPARV